METTPSVLGNFHNGLWSSETTWIIASGSLKNSVVFDSSEDSPVDSDPSPKSAPLILKPPAPDSSPCEIKLYFSQKYDIRQIYVRSTACVYEVYYTQPQHNDNEYLCTVRCSIAERDEQVLRAVNVEEVSVESKRHAAVELIEEETGREENNAPSEDDWVEVKVLDPSLLENGVRSLSNKKNPNTGGHIQDYYEATAEISDSDPCTSLTIRFLSLQNKGCVYIDEVYAFANPVGSIDSENQAPPVNGSAGSSLMSMLVPTLLQLSKSSISPIQREYASDKLGKGNKVESLTKLTDLSDVSAGFDQGSKLNADQQCVKLKQVDTSRVESVKSELHNENQNRDRSHDAVIKNDAPYAHIEKVLEQLVSRVSKIEEVCLRFEENMLKPINSMEMKIQQLEQQLESLTKNSQYSGIPPGTRISAPSFSCASNSSSFHNDGSDCQPCRGPELERKEFTSDALASPPDGMSKSVNAPRFLPSLVVTAPEFPAGDDELGDDVLEPCNENNQVDEVSKSLKDSPQDEVRKIDDILAAALSNFLSSSSDFCYKYKQAPISSCDTSKIISNEAPSENVEILKGKVHEFTASVNANEEPPKYTQILTVTAPEFSSEENGGEEDSGDTQFPFTEASKFAGKKSHYDNEVSLCGTESGISPDTSDSSQCIQNKFAHEALSDSNNLVSSGSANGNSITPDDILSEAAAHVQYQSFQESTDVCVTTDEIGQKECSVVSSPEKKDVLEEYFVYNTNTGSNRVSTAAGTTRCIAAGGPYKDILQNVSESSTASLIDFSLPILDVKFTSHENSSTHSSLEAFWSDLPDLNLEANSLGKSGGGFESATETNFSDIDDGKMMHPLTSKSLLVD
ncbi:hypothetical protein ACH5RR_000812 [Cinchona calisaya]|uniref:Uncharacterized protein n=1 Tax=Cinchona calisaya TaxID=153742 RepID=A0ABD3B1Z4_9GENT